MKAPPDTLFLVGAGILISRIIGVLRQRIFGYYFGASAEADVFSAAFRIPNFLQNVFGEGALSASLIPVYAGLLAKKDDEEANRVASAILTILALVTSILVVLGILATPYIIGFVAPGFEGEKTGNDDPLGQDSFSGRRAFGNVGVVSGDIKQPSQILSFVHCPGYLELRDYRRSAALWQPRRTIQTGGNLPRGVRWWEAVCNLRFSFRPFSCLSKESGLFSMFQRRTFARLFANFFPVFF